MYDINYHNKDISSVTFLVTGGAGFIGSNIVEYLLKYNAGSVIVLDNFSTGYFKNIESFLKYKNFTLIQGDIRDLDICKKAMKKVDYVIHQAALGSVPRSLKDPIITNEINVSGFLNMLVSFKESNAKRMVYAASSSTYGDSKTLPKTEDLIGKPLSPYAVTKYVNELYADVFSKSYGLEIVGLRYFNVFGQRQDPNGVYAAVIPKFAGQLLNGNEIIINGDGEHSRDFTYVEDVVQANIKSLFSSKKEAVNQVYNVAYGKRTSLNKLFKLLKRELSYFKADIEKADCKYGPERLGDVKHSLANIDKIKNLLEYNPNFDIETGLKEAVCWYYNNVN